MKAEFMRALVDRLQLKAAIRMAVAALITLCLSKLVGHYVHRPSYLIADLWAVMTAIVVLQSSVGGTNKAAWQRFLGVLLGSCIGLFFILLLGAESLSLGLALFASVVICALFNMSETHRLTAMSVVVIMLPWQSNHLGDPWSYAAFRFFDSCMGFCVAIAISHFLWPSRGLDLIEGNGRETFILLRQFLFALFPGPLKEFTNEEFANEKTGRSLDRESLRESIESAFNKDQMIIEESRSEFFNQSTSLEKWIHFIRYKEQLWENLAVLETLSFIKLTKVFDEKLNRQIALAIQEIFIAFNEVESRLTNRQTPSSFDAEKALDHLMQELVRFRSTHKLKSYSFDVVEDSFVFFYQLRKILIALKKINLLIS